MNQLDYIWLSQNQELLYTSRRMDTATINRIYTIYNEIMNSDKKPNSCGSCLRNTIQTVRIKYEQKKQELQ